MPSLDTNTVLRIVLGDVPQQTERSMQLLMASSQRSLDVADAVLFELVWVLSGPVYGFDRSSISEALLNIQSYHKSIATAYLSKRQPRSTNNIPRCLL